MQLMMMISIVFAAITSHGLSCGVCKLRAHKSCVGNVLTVCKWSTRDTVDQGQIFVENVSLIKSLRCLDFTAQGPLSPNYVPSMYTTALKCQKQYIYYSAFKPNGLFDHSKKIKIVVYSQPSYNLLHLIGFYRCLHGQE